jgi:hypothetical protein
MITIGALASVPVQIAVLAVAARLRRWTPADYLALNIPRRSAIVFAVLCTIALMIVFDALMFVSGRDLVPPFKRETMAIVQAPQDIGRCSPSSWSRWSGRRLRSAAFSTEGLCVPAMSGSPLSSFRWPGFPIQYDWLGMAQIFAAGPWLVPLASGSTTSPSSCMC